MFHHLRHWLVEALGWLLFFPPALVTHVMWWFLGNLAYPVAKLCGGDVTRIKSFYTLQAGPDYVSSVLLKHHAYFGCEPEGTDHDRVQPTKTLRLDITWAGLRFKARWFRENMYGTESKPSTPDVVVKVRGE